LVEGSVEEARIAVGSVGPVAVRASEAEALLTAGASPEDVAAAAADASGAVEDADGSEEYKRQLVRVLVGRALADAIRRA
jgi:CO/xanthine dehydrogenase FAD-binding subunit